MSESIENQSTKKDENKTKKDYEILGEEYGEYDIAFKVIIIGNPGVGKSCLSNRATKNFFRNDYSSTIAFEYYKFNIKLNDDVIIRLHIWDTCGQEVYRSLISNYYKSASLAILVYSINE